MPKALIGIVFERREYLRVMVHRGSSLSDSNFTVSVSGNDTLVSAGSDLLATLKYVQLSSLNIA